MMEDLGLLIIVIAVFIWIFDDEFNKMMKTCLKNKMLSLRNWTEKKLR